MQRIDYKGLIEDNFLIKTKAGEIIPFIFNDVQNIYYNLILKDYPTFAAIRENVLKGRQQGMSTLIDAIFTVDFLMSAMGKLPVITGQIISHKEKEVEPLFKRIDLFIDSFLRKVGNTRKDLLNIDKKNSFLESHSGAQLFVGTAGAKTLGRGGTLQNIHWSEAAFYANTAILNAKDLVTGAEQQVCEGIGKIFRESTGKTTTDFFGKEYQRGKEGLGDFKSRFFEWYLTREYQRAVEPGFIFTPEHLALMKKHKITKEQMFWYIKKLESKMDKPGDEESRDVLTMKREYPFDDKEAFLMSGDCYFSTEKLRQYNLETIPPMEKTEEGILIF